MEPSDRHRWTNCVTTYILYTRSVSRSSLSSGFKLESLPPTSAAVKFHSYRAYLAVQQWIGNNLGPTDWGWQHRDGILVPLTTDRPVSPTRVLRIVSCGCKTGCRKTNNKTKIRTRRERLYQRNGGGNYIICTDSCHIN